MWLSVIGLAVGIICIAIAAWDLAANQIPVAKDCDRLCYMAAKVALDLLDKENVDAARDVLKRLLEELQDC